MPKPSFGCMACRQRRVKCDERKGGCLKCERYRITCPGYKHPLDVVSHHLGVKKASSNNMTRIRLDCQIIISQNLDTQDHEHPSEISSTDPENFDQSKSSLIVQQPVLDIDLAALGAWYSSYCVSSATICSLEHIRSQGNGCLLAAIKMLGIMQLHQLWHLPRGCDAVVQQYGIATTMLNAALASPLESRKDSTLLATLLLSLVEMKASPDFSLNYWLIHTQGAAALMGLRGAEQVSTRLGAALFLQISSQIVIYCILGKHRVPSDLEALRQKIRPNVIDQEHPLWKWHGLMYRFANFAAAFEAEDGRAIENAQCIIDEAMSIYHDMEAVFDDAGTYWQHDVQPSRQFSPLINHEHVYHSMLTARVWNDRRTATILLFAMIARVAASNRRSGSNLNVDPECYMMEAYEVIRATALETLAATPQILDGLKGKNRAQLIDATLMEGMKLCDSPSEYDELVFKQTQQHFTTLPYLDSCRVQWSIYFAAKCEYVESRIRSRLLGVLEETGDILQISQFAVLAKNVRAGLEKPKRLSHGVISTALSL